ncbi:class I SAM-dependent methyltransferase [Calidifontibacter indicus]|uniref:Methyltransferase family protein n=1 Tax=Calidifontibacter indicus TaxID=419650 RepID=A0A3D9UM58_9MICO|nr:class I SAM-dependent methyltransferase [Calidifontibacter indicus]REF30387.1 methyltransferase family protein [Calidifontibacter indicus]
MSSPAQQDVYGFNTRPDVVPSIPVHARSALDVGCSEGGFGRTLRQVLGPDAHLVGVDAVPANVAAARANIDFDEVVEGYFPDAMAGRPETFDIVSFNDVLEHIVDPWATLEAVKGWLSPSGVVLAAIPNVQWLPVVIGLVMGRWDYEETGILDRTHVRFFTRKTIMDMFAGCGYEVLECRGANDVSEYFASDPVRWRRSIKQFAGRLSGDRRYMHFIVVARPVIAGPSPR